MQDNEFFVIDMASCTSTGEVINSLTLALEALNHSGKKIVLKLNDSRFNQSQMLSIQSLIASYGCILDTVETTNSETAHVAENMNIFVQEPIEKRVDSTDINIKKDGFETFSMSPKTDEIAFKEVSGLHFEADLDAIQKQQNSIDISSDLQNAGIGRSTDFQDIEDQIIKKYSMSNEESIASNSAELADFNKSIEEKEELPSDISSQKSCTYGDEASNSTEVNYQPFDTNIDKEAHNKKDNYNFENESVAEDLTLENAEKNTISVYKKAYDELDSEKEDWEEVDFYETPTDDPVVSDTKSTVYINQTLRSGQILESEGNVVIIGDCHPGSEIRAVGDITVWGVLSGIAHAGFKGNNNAKVRALKMNAVQLRIGNCYARRPDSTNIPYIIKSSVFTPEEARVVENEIMLFKINQN